MLSVSDFPQFRPQNDSIESGIEAKKLAKCEFLPANYYPVQTPGYTVHWSERELEVVERVDVRAKTVLELDTSNICRAVVFDTVPKHEKRRKRNNNASGGGFIKSLTGWLWNNWSKTQSETEPINIIQVIPLMYDKTIFDSVVVLKEKDVLGFVRMRLLATGSFENVQRIDGFIPAITGEIVKIVNWKSFMVAVNQSGDIKILDLDEGEAEWRESNVKGSIGCSDVIVCQDKFKETAVLLLQNGIKVEIFEFGNTLMKLGSFELLENAAINCGYMENNDLYVIQDKTLYKKSLKTNLVTHHTIEKPENCIASYLVPWNQDFQDSALIVYVNKISDKVFKITVVAIDGTESYILYESEKFDDNDYYFDFDSVSVFVSSSLEIFVADHDGNVLSYYGLVNNSDWDWQEQQNEAVSFEFSHWFNILGAFPFRSYEYYKERRTRFSDTLFIDDLLAEYQISFPPVDWKGLGQACTKLKVEVVLYYLLACDTRQEKINSFYYNFGLTDKQVAFIETCFYADHGEVNKAVKIFCTRKMEESQRNQLVGKLVKYLKFECENEEMVVFSLFCAGRLISIDLLIDDEVTMNLMIESILNGRGISVALEWIKGLFAWLRPDDRSALIPVASLHQQLLKRILNVLLSLKNNSKFKSLGNDFVESQFDPDTLRSILDHLSGCEGDRAAWLITMICASRGRLHRYLLDYDFEGIVKDEEVLKGIEDIKTILRPLVIANNNNDIDFFNTVNTYELGSPLVIPGTPQMNRSSSLKSISYNSPSKLVNVYARTPSSPQPLYSSPNSPTFTPKHYPPKKPTMLSSSLRKSQQTEVKEEETDPFKDDLIKLSGKRAREEILEWKPVETSESIQVPVILTKPETDDVKFESVIKVEVSRKSKRRCKANANS